jgi:hypothetical protein
MTPTEFQVLKKKYEEISSKIQLGEQLLHNLNMLSTLKEQLNKGKDFELYIDDIKFFLEYIGLETKDVKNIFTKLIDDKYIEYMKQWEELV